MNLFNDQKASGLQGDEASIELGEDDAHKLLEIAIRNEERTLFGFSMATRNHVSVLSTNLNQSDSLACSSGSRDKKC